MVLLDCRTLGRPKMLKGESSGVSPMAWFANDCTMLYPPGMGIVLQDICFEAQAKSVLCSMVTSKEPSHIRVCRLTVFDLTLTGCGSAGCTGQGNGGSLLTGQSPREWRGAHPECMQMKGHQHTFLLRTVVRWPWCIVGPSGFCGQALAGDLPRHCHELKLLRQC